MIKNLQNLKKFALGFFTVALAADLSAQCLTVTCPGNMTVTAPTSSCSAVVNYSAPIVNNACGITTTTYNYTGSLQTFTVPNGVNSMTIDARGAAGGNVSVSCVGNGGLGARMSGVVSVTPGQVISILVGQLGGTNGSDAGGGGGSFVVGPGNTPLVIAGGGGGASNNITNCGANINGMNASITTSATATTNGAGLGGVSGNGGFLAGGAGSNGAGGGFNTNGAFAGSANNCGKAYVNGGAGGFGGGGTGGYGGGGCGWQTGGNGGGGGGYSGGGSGGSNPYTAGGGGGSYNIGSNQVNAAGFQSGNGQVMLTYGSGSYTTSLTAGLPSGTVFPIGTTVQTYSVVNNFSNTATCSFSVLVLDAQTPTITCPASVTQCAVSVPSIAPASVLDNCPSPNVTYTLAGATTATGITNASGIFSVGVTSVTYKAMDASGNNASCAFSVTINASPSVSVTGGGTICVGVQSATLSASGANTYSWNTGSTSSSIAVTPTATATYTAVGTSSVNGCSSTVTVTVVVDPCTGINQFVVSSAELKIYPNPNSGEFVISSLSNVNLSVINNLGQLVKIISLNENNNHKAFVTNLSAGIYFIEGTNSANQKIKQKIIVAN